MSYSANGPVMEAIIERLNRLKADQYPPLHGKEFDKIVTRDRDVLDSNKKVEKIELDFVKAVGKGETTGLQFYPLEDKTYSSVAIPLDLVKEVAKSYATVMYGYFIGPRLPFPVVEKYLKSAWGKYGLCDAMINENGIFFFRFNDQEGCNKVVEMGPIMIKGIPLFVYKWDPTKGLGKNEHTTCPLWVKLHNIPLVAFNREGVSRISSALGIPKQMDACTANMCDKTWGRPGFAKVLVDVWAIGELKRKIEVIVPDLKGGKEAKVNIDVEYLWEPFQCSHCCVFGHKTNSCGKVPQQKKKEELQEGDGYTQVGKRQWRPKSQSRPHAQTPMGKSERGELHNGTQVAKEKTGILQEKNKEQEVQNNGSSHNTSGESKQPCISKDMPLPSTSNSFGILGNMTGDGDDVEVLMTQDRMEQRDETSKEHQ